MKDAIVRPAIHRYLGWWVRTAGKVGQIIDTGDVSSVVQFAEHEDIFGNSALLDSRISQLYPSKRTAMEAARQL